MKLLWPKEKERRIMNIIILNLNIERGTIITNITKVKERLILDQGNLILRVQENVQEKDPKVLRLTY